jgi:hypothetical protein
MLEWQMSRGTSSAISPWMRWALFHSKDRSDRIEVRYLRVTSCTVPDLTS